MDTALETILQFVETGNTPGGGGGGGDVPGGGDAGGVVDGVSAAAQTSSAQTGDLLMILLMVFAFAVLAFGIFALVSKRKAATTNADGSSTSKAFNPGVKVAAVMISLLLGAGFVFSIINMRNSALADTLANFFAAEDTPLNADAPTVTNPINVSVDKTSGEIKIDAATLTNGTSRQASIDSIALSKDAALVESGT